VLLDGCVQGRWVGSDDLGDLLAVLEELEGGHGADRELLGNVGKLIDVDLVEVGVGELVAVLDDGGGDDFAGTAPCGEAVDNDEVVFGVREGLRPGGLGFNVVDTHFD